MHMRPPPFEVPTDDPFTNDTLGRKDQVEALTNFLRNLDGPCVLAVDAAWGSGKTVFLKMLAENLRNQEFQVAELNAWETDFSKDPLIALFSALQPTLRMSSEPKGKVVLQTGAALISKLASSSVPFMPDIVDAIEKTSEQIQTAFEKRLETHREAVEAIHRFKDSLANVRDSDLPIVICVDELDRCRPNFAIEFLEAAKHIFDVDGVAFVLALNMSELANSVKVMYGNDFESNAYLRRFVDRVLYLPKPDRTRFIDDMLDSVGLSHFKNSIRFARIFFNDFVLESPHISLRDIEQSIHHLGVALRAARSPQQEAGVPMDTIVSALMMVRIVVPNTYQWFVRGEVSDLEVVTEMTQIAGRTEGWWSTEQFSERWKPRTMAVWEAFLITWFTYLGSSREPKSPLLEQRRLESKGPDHEYPDEVIRNYNDIGGPDEWKFRRALALIEMLTFDPE